jgi:plastocyanin
MNTRPLLIVIGAVIVLVLLYLAFSAVNSEKMPEYGTATTTPPVATTSATAPTVTTATTPGATTGPVTTTMNTTITYGANGFSSSNVTVPVGTTVTWVNQGGDDMWVATARHPDHTVYDGTSTDQHCTNTGPTSAAVFDQCGNTARYSFTFTKPGTWFYHNHSNARHFGSVTVTQ